MVIVDRDPGRAGARAPRRHRHPRRRQRGPLPQGGPGRVPAADRRRVRPHRSTKPARPASPAAWPSAATSMPTSPRAGSRSRARSTPPTSTWSGPAAAATTWARSRSCRRRANHPREPARQAGVLGTGQLLPPGQARPLARIAGAAGLLLQHRDRARAGEGRRQRSAGDGDADARPSAPSTPPASATAPTAAPACAWAWSAATSTTAATRRWARSTGRETRKTATAQYRIPAFAWLDGWYTASLQYYDEQTDYIDTRKVELVASRSGQINRRLDRGRLGARAARALGLRRRRRRRRRAAGAIPLRDVPVSRRCAAEYIDADDRIFPRKGARRHARGARRTGRRRLRCQLRRRPGRQARWYHGLGASQPPDRARRSRRHLHQRAGRHAAEPALLRRRRPQHPRLRLPRSRPDHHRQRRQEVRAGREERAHRLGRVRALLQRHLGRARASSTPATPSTTPRTSTPASASACAGRRRWGRCASTSHTA